MALHIHSAIKTDYPFLAHPPQKKRPLQPLPAPPSFHSSPEFTPAQAARRPHRGTGTFSAIAAWATLVQPGSPASLSPCSPHRRPSLRRNHCPSVTTSFHVAPTPTITHLATPSIRDFQADLTTVGYTSVFLQLPNTPVSATLPLAIKSPSPNVAKSIPISPAPSLVQKPCSLTRFRSLSILRSRGGSKFVCLDSPTKMKAKAAAASAAIVKRKKAKYALRPPPLMNELALMQFADGGSTDDNIKRIMEVQAKAAGAGDLADIYRDGHGGVWWDQDEELEYAHLLSEGDDCRPHTTGDPRWVTFGGNSPSSMAVIAGETRRDSVSTQNSDLDPKYVVQPIDSLGGDDLALLGSAIVPLATPKPTTSLSSRPCRDMKYLRQPNFSNNMAFSRLGDSPRSPKSPVSVGTGAGVSKPRRRPAPLKLSPPGPRFKRLTSSPVDADKVRQDFIQASFEPVISVPVTPATATVIPLATPVDARGYHRAASSRAMKSPWWNVNGGLMDLGMRRKPSMLNIIGRFKSVKKEGFVC